MKNGTALDRTPPEDFAVEASPSDRFSLAVIPASRIRMPVQGNGNPGSMPSRPVDPARIASIRSRKRRTLPQNDPTAEYWSSNITLLAPLDVSQTTEFSLATAGILRHPDCLLQCCSRCGFVTKMRLQNCLHVILENSLFL
jgi:hypothetical protein